MSVLFIVQTSTQKDEENEETSNMFRIKEKDESLETNPTKRYVIYLTENSK